MRWLFTIPILLLAGCADLGYYWHNARGHLAVMDRRVEIESLLADESLDAGLRARLERIGAIRRFASERLALPDNDSYRSYVELDRPYVVRNLFAAPEFSTRLQTWCYPVIGCASYRGYFDDERLQAYVAALEAEGLETYIGPVAAYSTLGWFDDPVLSSFVAWPEYRLAGLLFHELTHQRIFIDDDTSFNESLASAVQQVGTELWLVAQDDPLKVARHRAWSEYRASVIALIGTTRTRLSELYATALDDTAKRKRKQALLADARAAHTALADEHGITGGFTRFFADGLNNAKLGSVSAYHSRVAAFRRMLDAQRLDFAAFFVQVEAIAGLDAARRNECLDAWEALDEAAIRARCPAVPARPIASA